MRARQQRVEAKRLFLNIRVGEPGPISVSLTCKQMHMHHGVDSRTTLRAIGCQHVSPGKVDDGKGRTLEGDVYKFPEEAGWLFLRTGPSDVYDISQTRQISEEEVEEDLDAIMQSEMKAAGIESADG